MKSAGALVVAERYQDLRHPLQRDPVVGLFFDGRDRILDEASIGIADRLIGILPAVILQTAAGPPFVFQKTIAITVAEPSGPLERAERGIAIALECGDVARPMPVLAERDHEHRGCRLRAVVRAPRNEVQL